MSGPQRTSEERRISFENALSRSLKIGEGVWSCSRLDERTISALTDIAEYYPRRSELLILAAQMRFAENVLAMTLFLPDFAHWN